jgi:hypothetical protein
VSLSGSVAKDDRLRLLAAGPFETLQQVDDFLDASDEVPADGGLSERATLIDNKRLQGLAPAASSWDEFLVVVNAVVAVAGVASAVAGAVTAVYSVTQI